MQNFRFNPVPRPAASGLALATVALLIAGATPNLSHGDEPKASPAPALSLNGQWRFSTDAEKPLDQWDTLLVPGNWDTTNDYSHYRGTAYYQRSFDVPPAWKNRHVRLHFDAVAGDAVVWLNGKELGRHHGGFTQFEFDVTQLLRNDRPNELRVSSDNSTKIGAFWPWGGISRNVSLISSGDLRIVHQHVWADPDLGVGTAHVTGTVRLANDGDSPLEADVATQIEGTAAIGKQHVTVAGHSTSDLPIDFILPKADVRLWDFDHPNLYRVTTHLSTLLGEIDSNSARFGIRKIEVKPDGLLLNGQRVRLNGFNRVSDHRAYGNTEPLHLIMADVDRMKQYGANLMRLMHTPQSPELLDYLDERGMLIFEEIPVWGNKDPNIKADSPVARQWLREMIERDYNHPSIIGWSVGNEMIGHGPYVRSMIPFIRQNLDGHRLLTYVSNSAIWSKPGEEPEDAADLMLENYYGDLAAPAKTLHGRWPNKPVFFSEYGRSQFGDGLSSTIPKYDQIWKGVAEQPYVIGASLWTFNDYRSDFKGSSPAELRSWGIVDQWRQPKAAVRQIERINAPVQSLKIEGTIIFLSPREKDQIPSYPLSGYYLEWEWQRPNGSVTPGWLVALDRVDPGDAIRQFDAGTGPGDASAMLVAKLVSPGGDVVAQSDWWDSQPASAAAPASRSAGAKPRVPIVRHIEPLDGAFMVAYDTQKDDTSMTVEYRGGSGEAKQLTLSQPGALVVNGLTNGQAYAVRLRRTTAVGVSEWSEPVTVRPDGGQKPAAPVIQSVVCGKNGIALVQFTPIDKAIGYRLRYAGRTLDIPTAATGSAIIRDLEGGRDYDFTLTAITENGESAASEPYRASAVAK